MPSRVTAAMSRRSRNNRQPANATRQSSATPSVASSPEREAQSGDEDAEEEMETVDDLISSARNAKVAAPSRVSSRQAQKRKRVSSSPDSDARDSVDEDGNDDDDKSDNEAENEDDEEDGQDYAPAKQPAKRGAPRKSTRKTMPKSSAAKRGAPGRKKARVVTEVSESATEENALFEAVKDAGTALTETATQWIQEYELQKTSSLKEMVSFILLCCGCNVPVTEYDIEDQDSAAQTLAQIQDAFSQRPEFKKFRSHLLEFFSALIEKSAEREILYDDESLMENLQIWITAMSSSTIRPFRYTATNIGMCMLSTLCEVAADIAKATGRSTKLLEKEKEKARPAKEKLKKMQETVNDYAQKTEVLEGLIHDLFDTIFVHRYRDIDSKIRSECIRDLTKWMQTLPDLFFEGQYLRYLGWILSDPIGSTRLEAVKGLTKLYKDRYFAGGLRQFTEKFRPRLLEMATHDVDHTVRMATIDLLDAIRAIGFLEQEDVDEVSGLIFDSNPRVRKAVVSFFVANIKEIVTEKFEEIGDAKEIRLFLSGEDSLPTDEEDTPMEEDTEQNSDANIQKSWFVLKTIVEMLDSHNQESIGSPIRASKMEILIGGRTESRFSIAAQALWEATTHLPEWSDIIRYSLYDSSITNDESDQSVGYKIKKELQLTAQQELILLEVAVGAVEASREKTAEVQTEKRSKRGTVAERLNDELIISRDLIPLMPQLLKRFSSDPETAAVVLRLHNFINLDAYQQLRQKTSYEEVLDGMCKIFMSFDSAAISREFIHVLLQIQSCEYLSDVLEFRVKDMQDDAVRKLKSSVEGVEDLATAALFKDTFESISAALDKLLHLASVADISDCLEHRSTGDSDDSAVAILISLMDRTPSPNVNESAPIITSTAIIRFYVMWKVKACIQNQSDSVLTDFLATLDTIVDRCESLIKSRANLNVRHSAICALIDIMTSINVLVRKEGIAVEKFQPVLSAAAQKTSMKVFALEEKAFAKEAKHKLVEDTKSTSDENDGEISAEDDEDEPGESESDEESVEQEELEATDKAMNAMEREIKLCELTGKFVVAILSGSMDPKYADRLMLNAKVLGPSYERIVDELSRAVRPVGTTGRQRK